MLHICILTSMAAIVTAKFEGFIVGGSSASITEFPHAAYLGVNCVTTDLDEYSFGCGSSILTQQLILTAAHCIFECIHMKTRILINMGNENKFRGVRRYASHFICHEKYDPVTSECDIALLRMTKPVWFNLKIQRVAIMTSPPYHEPASLAGWGLINEKTYEYATHIKKLDQSIWQRKNCLDLLKRIPRGTFCASSGMKSHYAAWGDSGSGLVVRGYIQIGLVSFKLPSVAKEVLVYTDVGYHYNWIEFNAHRLCDSGTR